MWGGKVLATHLAGREHWMLLEVQGRKIILVNLLESIGGQWGYKTMDECMGPYYYQVPLAWLDQAPVASAKWRAEVQKRAEAQARAVHGVRIEHERRCRQVSR